MANFVLHDDRLEVACMVDLRHRLSSFLLKLGFVFSAAHFKTKSSRI